MVAKHDWRRKEKEKRMKVYNINGTSDNTCKCGSWKQHWINFSGQKWPKCCCEKNCSNSAEVGAHVQKVNGSMRWYIVPFCKKHNNKAQSLEILDSTILVPANRSETCE